MSGVWGGGPDSSRHKAEAGKLVYTGFARTAVSG
jgi:hypothetical protein